MLMDKFWVVKNPTEHSTKADICWETDVNTFAAYVLGTGKDRFELECHAVHTSETTADADASFKLQIRDGIMKALAGNRETIKKLGESEKTK